MPPANVSVIELNDWKKDDGSIVKVSNVTFADGTTAPGYDLPPGLEEGKPLPDGWEVAQSKAGKPYIKYPRAGKGGPMQAAYRNTKEGQAYEQERMDRRTALMQAVAAYENDVDPLVWQTAADKMYEWLRKTAGGVTTLSSPARGGVEVPITSPAPSSSPEANIGSDDPRAGATPSTGDVGKAGGSATGEGSLLPACTHEMTSPLTPGGKPLKEGRVRCIECGRVMEVAS